MIQIFLDPAGDNDNLFWNNHISQKLVPVTISIQKIITNNHIVNWNEDALLKFGHIIGKYLPTSNYWHESSTLGKQLRDQE